MLKFLRSALIAIVVVLALGGAAAYALLQDANRFKPRLEALIETQTGVPLRINGDLAWRLWPPVSLSAEDLQADYQDQSWQVGQVTLDLDALDLLGDPGQWEIQALTLRDVAMSQQGGLLQVSQARMAELAPNRPAPFDTQFSYTAPGGSPLPVDMQGSVQVDPETLALALKDTRIVTPQAEG